MIILTKNTKLIKCIFKQNAIYSCISETKYPYLFLDDTFYLSSFNFKLTSTSHDFNKIWTWISLVKPKLKKTNNVYIINIKSILICFTDEDREA
jgi:hypothetical protein